MNTYPRAKDSTSYPVVFHLVLSVDHTTDATGKTPALTRSKNGGAFNAATGAVSEIGSGWYSWAGNATDRDTLGPLACHVTATGCDTTDFVVPIITQDLFAANLGIAGVTLAADQAVNVTKWNGSSVAAPNVAGVPKVDVVDWLGSAPNALQAGRVDSYLGAIASGVIAAASFAANAITSTVIADGAITATKFATGALDAVWSTASRTLTSFGTLVTDIWSAGTRTLTSLSALAADIAGAVLDAVAASYNTAGSIGAKINSGGLTVQQIVDGVWDEPSASHLAAGSTGESLSNATTGGDPWSTAVPGAYGAGTAGYILGNRLDVAVSSRAAAGVSVTVTSPVTQTGDVTIEQGDDYFAADNRAIVWELTGSAPSLVGATVRFKIKDWAKVCTAVGTTVTLELTAAETALLRPVTQRYEVEATLADGHVVSLVRGSLAVTAQIEG